MDASPLRPETGDLSPKGQRLIGMYREMAQHGYRRTDGGVVETAYASFELKKFRKQVQPFFRENKLSSVLDYGCGGCDWTAPGFGENDVSAQAYFGLETVYRYEPARGIDERQMADGVVSFDVLEHVFISDVPKTIREIFSFARKAVVLNVACYKAAALLPNGENAHVTVREPAWWKGMVDCISVDHPGVNVFLICSTAYREAVVFPVFSDARRQADDGFAITY